MKRERRFTSPEGDNAKPRHLISLHRLCQVHCVKTRHSRRGISAVLSHLLPGALAFRRGDVGLLFGELYTGWKPSVLISGSPITRCRKSRVSGSVFSLSRFGAEGQGAHADGANPAGGDLRRLRRQVQQVRHTAMAALSASRGQHRCPSYAPATATQIRSLRFSKSATAPGNRPTPTLGQSKPSPTMAIFRTKSGAITCPPLVRKSLRRL